MSSAAALPAPGRVKLVFRRSPWLPTRYGAELLWDALERPERRILDEVLKLGSLREKVLRMAGSDTNYLSKSLGDLALGKTAYAGETTLFHGLWTAALDDTFNGATANEANYTSYARLSLTNNTTIFAAGSGTTTYVKTWPSDALKSFAAATGGSSVCTYIGQLNGNAGTSGDKGTLWASLTSVTINFGDTPQLAQNAFSQTRD